MNKIIIGIEKKTFGVKNELCDSDFNKILLHLTTVGIIIPTFVDPHNIWKEQK